jgi:UDP-hydrolysing UDP-N-acetyl-D-glucosamine 2-epimerase
MRRIAAVTTGRADYGHLRSVLNALHADPRCELAAIVAGTHLSADFGLTVTEIERDRLPIKARVPSLAPGADPHAAATTAAQTLRGVSEALTALGPDLLVLLGDRYEILAAGLAATLHGVPIAHVHGGETSLGALDEAVRHALTKLAHLHFCAVEPYAQRVRAMGEPPNRVFVTGAPGLDTLLQSARLDEEAFAQRVPGLVVRRPLGLVTFHPVTLEPGETARQVAEVLGGCDILSSLLLTYPNADMGHDVIVAAIEHHASRRPHTVVVPSLGPELYANALRLADVMVGNSSSGIVEAASFQLPVVNVGRRQEGRLKAPNVIDAPPDRASVSAAVTRALDPGFRAGLAAQPNPYGDGKSGPRIAEILVTFPLDGLLYKPFHPDPAYLDAADRAGLRF